MNKRTVEIFLNRNNFIGKRTFGKINLYIENKELSLSIEYSKILYLKVSKIYIVLICDGIEIFLEKEENND